MNGTAQELLHRLEERGFRGRIVAIERLQDLQEGIEGWRRRGLFDETLYGEYLSGFSFSAPEALPAARSLIVVANPQPQVRIVFHWQGKAVPVILPPTYVSREPDRQVRDLLAEVLEPAGYDLVRAAVPAKLLAVRSGLGQYGRNNVCYVPGLGSFHRLVAFYSDLPCQEDAWQEPRLMAACERCTACLRHCPSGAIAEERFLLRAERCLTWHNERPVALAGWIDPAWHNAIVGCMHCQRVCPENRAFLEWVEPGPAFSEAETGLLLRGTPAEELPPEMVARLAAADLDQGLDILPRNLGLLLQASTACD